MIPSRNIKTYLGVFYVQKRYDRTFGAMAIKYIYSYQQIRHFWLT